MALEPLLLREFVVTLMNRPGALGAFDTGLGRAGVDVAGYLLQGQGDTSLLRFLPEDPARAEGWLRVNGHTFQAGQALVVQGEHRPGFLGSLASRLGAAGVNIEASYPATLGGRGCVVLSVDAPEAALEALEAAPGTLPQGPRGSGA